MMGTDNNTPVVSQMALSLADMNVIAESVVGYRRILINGGVPDDTATAMARQFHDVLLDAARSGLGIK
jgi:hypothetical protein